jgi:hypothetical protein
MKPKPAPPAFNAHDEYRKLLGSAPQAGSGCACPIWPAISWAGSRRESLRIGRRSTSFDAAEALAKEAIARIAKGEAERAALSHSDADLLLRSKCALHGLAVPLDVAARHFAQAVSILGAVNFKIGSSEPGSSGTRAGARFRLRSVTRLLSFVMKAESNEVTRANAGGDVC